VCTHRHGWNANAAAAAAAADTADTANTADYTAVRSGRR
jgi:hypothetical protein